MRVGDQLDDPAEVPGALDDVVVELVARRARDHQLDTRHRRGERERSRDVVAVADVRESPAVETTEDLTERQQIGEGLGRVSPVGEEVHDRNGRGVREPLEDRVIEHTRGDHRAIRRERARDVLDGLARADSDLLAAHVHGMSAERGDRHLGRDPCPRRGLLEEQRRPASRQHGRDRARIALPRLRPIQDRHETTGVQIVDLQQARRAHHYGVALCGRGYPARGRSLRIMRPPRR